MVTSWRGVTAVACVFAAAGLAAWSQARQGGAPPAQGPQAAPGAQAGTQRTRELIFRYEGWEYTDEPGGGQGSMRKFWCQDGDTEFTGDLLKLNEKEKTAVATGNVKVVDPQADVTGERAVIHYGRSRRLVVLTGSVRIVLKPKETGAPAPDAPAPVIVQDGKAVTPPPGDAAGDDTVKSARSHPVTITCSRVEYEYGRDKKHGVLTGSFKAVQQVKDHTRTMTASRAEWFGRDERVDLHPPVHYEDTKGTRLDTDRLVPVSVKEGDERIKFGPGTATVRIEDEEEDEGGAPATPPAGGR